MSRWAVALISGWAKLGSAEKRVASKGFVSSFSDTEWDPEANLQFLGRKILTITYGSHLIGNWDLKQFIRAGTKGAYGVGAEGYVGHMMELAWQERLSILEVKNDVLKESWKSPPGVWTSPENWENRSAYGSTKTE